MWHLKDEKEIYYLTKEYQIAYIERLADICKKAYSDKKNKDDILREALGIPNENRIDKKEHKYEHTECKGCDTDTRTEKRICRCMYYFNQNEYPKRCDNKSCKFYKKWKNVGDIEIVDYEVPTKYVIDQVGGIDLILKDKNGKLYGAEVKPEYSEETLGRMVAETLSYTIGTKYKPAIVVFEAGEHKQKEAIDWFRKKGNEGHADWKKIEKYVKVFIVRYKDKGKTAEFEILPY